MNDDPVPVSGDITTIEQVERLITYIDYELEDLSLGIAASFDQIQQAITVPIGMLIGEIGKRLKRDLQKVGRQLAKLQQQIDFDAYKINKSNQQELEQIESIQVDPAGNIDDINIGTVPEVFTTPDLTTGDPNDPIPACTENQTRINDATCEVEICRGGQWFPTGLFNQQCIDNKNNNGNGDPDPTDPNTTQDLCVGTAGTPNPQLFRANYYDVLYPQLGTNSTKNTSLVYSPDITNALYYNYKLIHSSRKSGVAYSDLSDRNNDFTGDLLCPTQYTVTIPYRRNTVDNISPYTEEGENYIRQKLGGSNVDGVIYDTNTGTEVLRKLNQEYKPDFDSIPKNVPIGAITPFILTDIGVYNV